MVIAKIITFLCVSESQVSFLATLTEVVTIWGFIFALPSFILQMKAENATALAKEIISVLPDLKKEIISLLKESHAGKRRQILLQLSCLLTRVDSLLALMSLPVNMKKEVQKLLGIVKNFRHDDYPNEPMMIFLEEIFGENWRDEKEKGFDKINISFIEVLNNELHIVYKDPILINFSSIKWMFSISILIYFIKVFFPGYEMISIVGMVGLYFLCVIKYNLISVMRKSF